MSACGKWERLITPYLMDELDDLRRREFESHLADCDGCRKDLELTRAIMSGAADLAREADAVTDDIQWGAVEAAILAGTGPRRIPVFRYAVQTLMMICLVLPVALLVTSIPVADEPDAEALRLDDRLEGAVAHEAGHGTHHQIRVAHRPGHRGGNVVVLEVQEERRPLGQAGGCELLTVTAFFDDSR